MATLNLQIRHCTSVAYDYLQNRSDKNSVALQKQLQSLLSVSDLEIFEPTSLEILELYLCLEKFLTPAEARSTLAGRVLTVLMHISAFPTVRAALRDDIKLVPALSNFLVNAKLSRDNLLKTLNLLNDLSYRLQVPHLEAWLLELVPFLATSITEGTLGDESLLLALQILANLCRASPVVVDCLRHLPNNKKLIETLSLLRNATLYIRLLTAEMYFFIDPDMSTADMLEGEILDMTFAIAVEGFEENRVPWVQLAADVFEELTMLPSLETVLKEYKNYTPHLQLLLGRLTSDTPAPLAEALMEFVLHLVRFNHQDIRSLNDTIFSKVATWIQSRECGRTAIQLVRELMAASGVSSLSQANMDSLVKAVKSSLSSSEASEATFSDLEYITVVLSLVEHVSSASQPVQVKLALNLEPSIFSNLLKSVLALHAQHTAPQDFPEAESSITTISSRKGNSSHSKTPGAGKCGLKSSQKLALSKTVITILTVTKALGSIKPEHLEQYKKMMSTPTVMGHIAWGVQGGAVECAAKAWSLVSGGNLSKECLDALVATSETPAWPTEATLTGTHKCISSFPADFEEKVDSVIDSLGGRVRKMEFQECALTDIFHLYEYKLASMVHYEKSLQDGLRKANVQNRQMHHLHLQTMTQNDHLRSLLARWEMRFQKSQEEKEGLQKAMKEVEEESRLFKDKFIEEKEKLERQTKDMKRELQAVKGVLKTCEDKTEKLQQQLSSKVEEIKTLKSQVQEGQEKRSKLNQKLQKQEEELKQEAKHVEMLKKEVEALEGTKQRLEKENGDLELLVKNKDETIAAKEEELQETNSKLNELAAIQNMIHDISSRRVT